MNETISLRSQRKDQHDISIISELMYQLKVRDVMTKNVCTVNQENSLRDVQHVMRDNKISGVPVVSDRKLVGIVSLDDIIRALDNGNMDLKVADRMTINVQTVSEGLSVVKAIDEMEQCGFGRLPVIDKSNNLVGIVTHWDVVRKLIFLLQDVVLKTEERERSLADTTPSHVEHKKEASTFEFQVVKDDFENAGIASSTIKKQLQKLDVPPAVIRRVAVAMYETEINIIIHSLGGKMTAEIFPEYIRLTAKDNGPGITHLDDAMKEGFSTASAKVREMGFGAGMGLSNIKRCVDNFQIQSSAGESTEIIFCVQFNDQSMRKK